ncbi:MAG: hypothetical protein ACYCYR_10300 [Desulfobulbaceae bacterium]
MAREREGKGPSDTNAQIITTDPGRIYRPQNLLSAISEIQQFYVIESKGQDIPAEFLTLERTLDFFRIGIRSGFHEGLILVLLFPVIHFYVFPFALQRLDLFSQILFGSIPYLPLIINTAMCSYLSRYFVGNITRKGIYSLLMGRCLALLLKASLVYVVYLVLFRLSTPKNIWPLSAQFGSMAGKVYAGIHEIKPHLVPVATRSAILLLLGAMVPYCTVILLDRWHRYRIRRNRKIISAPR